MIGPYVVEGPHDAAGYYTCRCGRDRRGKPYNRRSVWHSHELKPLTSGDGPVTERLQTAPPTDP